MTDLYKLVNLDARFPNDDDAQSVENYLPYIGRPSQDLSSYEQFMDELMVSYDDLGVMYEEDGEDYEEIMGMTREDLVNRLNEVVSPNVKNIYTAIDYPLSRPANFKFTIEDNLDVTYGFLLYTYSVAYQIVCDIEDKEDGDPGTIPGLLNRAQSNGQFGIWGHGIGDLVYNGSSNVSVSNSGEDVWCYFDVDS